MYEYIRQWPKDREMGWSHEANGVCHDQNNWFFSQNGILWKFPITHRIGDTCKEENRANQHHNAPLCIFLKFQGNHLFRIDNTSARNVTDIL